MRLIVENRFALLVLVLIALTALFGVAAVTRTVGAEPGGAESPAAAPVQSALRMCPPPQGDDRTTRAAALATGSGGKGGGRLSAAENTADADTVGDPAAAGSPWSADTSGAEQSTAVSAEGPSAAGLDVTQTTLGDEGAYATEVRCAEPGISTWFAAPGGTDLEELRLLLANPDQDAATANVDVYISGGPVYSDETRGISVEGRGSSEIELTDLIQGSRAAVVHVRTNSGRVAPALFADRGGSGQDWVPPTTAPSRTHVIPAIPAGKGNRRLIVAAPGDTPVTADVRLYTDEGRVEHDTLQDLSVPPAAGAFLSLEGPLGKQAGTAVVKADRPVVVGVAASRSGGDDTAYTAAAPPLQGPLNGTAVVPANPEDTFTQLVFAALDGPATAVVSPFGADGGGEPERVKLKAGRTTVFDAAPPEDAQAFTVRIDGDRPVHAGRVLTHESGGSSAMSALPLLPAPAEVALPPVEDSLTAIVE
ncbi:hypothetical protein GCM10027570_39220 [Streptomonospora sediminis]